MLYRFFFYLSSIWQSFPFIVFLCFLKLCARVRDMGRGRIEIKKIDNPTNRQVTYSKRKLGIMKKAKELTVLCDAQVSVIMFSNTGKFAEYCSPSTNTKKIVDRYQKETGIDLWNDLYEKMQCTLRRLEEDNQKLRKEIRQRIGEDLDGMSIRELRDLEQSLDVTLMHVSQRKYHVIATQTETYKKKLKSIHEAHKTLMHALDMEEDQHEYAFMTEDANDHIEADGTRMFTFPVHPNHPNLLEFGFGSHDLSLG